MTATSPLESSLGKSSRVRFPARAVNRAVFGRCVDHPNVKCGCEFARPMLSYCGKAVAESRMMLVEERADGGWAPTKLVSCRSAWACDFCSGRHASAARVRARWHAEGWLGSGGRLALATFTLSHSERVSLGREIKVLRGSLSGLRQTVGWKRELGIVDYACSLEVKRSTVNGWHAHLHVLLFLDGDGRLGELEPVLVRGWNAQLENRGGSGGSASVRARLISTIAEALYPWKYGPNYGSESDLGYYDPANWDVGQGSIWDEPDVWDVPFEERDDEYSVSPWDLARLAYGGDRSALRLWMEYVDTTSGMWVVGYSAGLNEAWKPRAAELEAEEGAEEAERPVRVVVDTEVWNRCWARRGMELSEDGLRAGEREGVAGLVRTWSDGLGIQLRVELIDVGGGDAVPRVCLPIGMENGYERRNERNEGAGSEVAGVVGFGGAGGGGVGGRVLDGREGVGGARSPVGVAVGAGPVGGAAR